MSLWGVSLSVVLTGHPTASPEKRRGLRPLSLPRTKPRARKIDMSVRNCEVCGKPIFGPGYVPGFGGVYIKTGSGTVGGSNFCSKKCYLAGTSSAERATNEITNKLVWTLVGLFIPPILIFIYWNWIWATICFFFRMAFKLTRFVFSKIIFTKFFWKYVVPVIAIMTGIGMYLAHLEFVRKCEAEMRAYSETAAKEEVDVVAKLKQERKKFLAAKEKQRAEEAKRLKEEEERQKAELAAALSAAKEEAIRQKAAQDMESFAKERFPEKWNRLVQVKEEIAQLEEKVATMPSEAKRTAWEESETGSSVLKARNRLIREKRQLEAEIEGMFNARK